MTDTFMLASDFVPGAQVRIGKGFSCLREGAVHTVTTDSVGAPCIRCQFEGQKRAGWHYPLGTMPQRHSGDDPLSELFLERAAQTAGVPAEQREQAIAAASRAMAEHGYDFPLPVDGDLDDEERGRYEALCAAIDAAQTSGERP